MLQASLLTTGAVKAAPTTTPPTVPPKPTTTKSSTASATSIANMYSRTPVTPTPAPTKLDPFPTATATKMPVSAALYTCVNNVCTATGQLGFTFQTLQSLINTANNKLGNAAIAVDGKLDARTIAAYLPVARTIGGVLATIDFAPTPDYLAKNADAFARAIAQWAGMTWVEATADMAGHWERMRAGQTPNLPTMPTQTSTPAPTNYTVMQPTPAPTTPTPTPGGPAVSVATGPAAGRDVFYICADGTRVSNTSMCPVTPTPTPAPQSTGPAQAITNLPSALPDPSASTSSARYTGCIARFNRTRRIYAIYCPVGSAGATPGLGTTDQEYLRCLRGNCVGLGETTVTPPPPAGMVKAAEVTTLPGAGEIQAGEERDKFWRLDNPFMWAAIAGAATVVGGGSFVLYRRKRRSE